jgi:hypothetical protein
VRITEQQLKQIIREEVLRAINEIATGNFDDPVTMSSITAASQHVKNVKRGEYPTIKDMAQGMKDAMSLTRADERGEQTQYDAFKSTLQHNLNNVGLAQQYKALGMEDWDKSIKRVWQLIELLGTGPETFKKIVSAMAEVEGEDSLAKALRVWENTVEKL